MPVPNARFLELLRDLEPSPTTKGRAAEGHIGIRDHLRTHATFGRRYVTSFLSGSYARDTSIRPRVSVDGRERPDVDIIVVTDFTVADAPHAVLNEVAEALEDGNDGFPVERINKRSVRVETWRADMDVVPLIEAGGAYLIADRENGEWKFTNPPVHTGWSRDRNVDFDGRFKPLVKMLKWWRRVNPSGRRPKGFVLEVLASMHAPPAETHYGEAFAQLLENIVAEHGALAAAGGKPSIVDPAVAWNDILAKVTPAQWRDFVDKARVYAGIARRAQETDDMDEATRQWRRVFGDRFKPTVDVARAAAYGGFATAPASIGYTFPDAMAAPASKPRGFA